MYRYKSQNLLPVPNIIFLSSANLIPSLAVIKPTESILVTSSYVNVPPIDTLPLNVASPVKVDTPATVIPALISTGKVLNVAAVPVIILSVEATPINPEPSPEKLLPALPHQL